MDAERFLANQAWCGPRATVLIPPEEAARLDGLELPDAAAYDAIHALEVALLEDRRKVARRHAAEVAASAPGGALAHQAALELAAYDRDMEGIDRTLRELERLFPGTPEPAARRLRYGRRPGGEDQPAAALAAIYPRDDGLLAEWAFEASLRPGGSRLARRLLRPLLRAGNHHTEALNLATLAQVHRDEGRFAEALELRRLAAHLAETDEDHAWEYFLATKRSGRADRGLAFLRRRAASLGARAAAPAGTLHAALRELGDDGVPGAGRRRGCAPGRRFPGSPAPARPPRRAPG
jgi:hypothetical protein